MHTLQAQQAAAVLKAALIGFYAAMEAQDVMPGLITANITVADDLEVEASFEVYHGNHPALGGSL